MIKTALSASLIALAILAPAASAADEVKPPRQTDQAAPTCRTPAAEVDPKAAPAPRLTKVELEALKKLPLCSSEEPEETCLMVDRAEYDKAIAFRRTSGAATPPWVQAYDLCMLRQLGDQSGAEGAHH